MTAAVPGKEEGWEVGRGLSFLNCTGLVPGPGWGRVGWTERAATPHFAEPRWRVRENHLIVHREGTSHFGRRCKRLRSSPHSRPFLLPSLWECSFMGTRRASGTLTPGHATSLQGGTCKTTQGAFPRGVAAGAPLCAHPGQGSPTSSQQAQLCLLPACLCARALVLGVLGEEKEEGVETARSFRGKQIRVSVKYFRPPRPAPFHRDSA